jgi:hypothetical protein
MFGKILNNINKKLLETEKRSGSLYAVAALFDTPDQIINAAETVSDSGYKKFDALTPYPVHGLDSAMDLKPTKIGWVGFFAGLIGTTLAFLMIWWMVGINYPNIFGGKPYFNLPPSVPIMFELTVLLSALILVGSLIAIFMKLPFNANPLMDTEFMKRVTSDKYGLYIESKDEKFNLEEIKSLFSSLGASSVMEIFEPVYEEGKTKNLLLDGKFITSLAVIAVVTSVVSYFVLNMLLFMPPFNWMHFQPRVNPQSQSKFFADGWSMRKPVEGTVARGFIPYEFKGMPDSLVVPAPNPLPFTQKYIDLGKKRYNSYCSPCHGYFGKGDSRLRGQFPVPPSLLSDKVKNWKDANIYHVITNGQNTMPSYESSISRDDRWAIIHYIRVLQRAQDAPDSDLGNK